MTTALLPIEPAAQRRRGGCEFLTPADRSSRCRELATEGWLVARVVPVFEEDSRSGTPTPPPVRSSSSGGILRRGRLREALEGAVEISLALRGALPPTVEVGAASAETARDQLFRVKALGAPGLCLVLPELRKLCEDETLDPADGAALLDWAALCARGPVVLLCDEGDRCLGVLMPRPLADALGAGTAPRRWTDDTRALGEDETPPPIGIDEPSGEELKSIDDVDAGWVLGGDALESEAASQPADDEDGWEEEEETREMELDRVMRRDPLADLEPLDETLASRPIGSAAATFYADRRSTPPQATPQATPTQTATPAAMRKSTPPKSSPGAPPRRALPVPRKEPLLAADTCARWSAELDAAQGPRPVRAIEELFKTRYVPLSEALGRGLDDKGAARAVDAWRAAFEKSYIEGFTAMRLTGKRPAMVLDAPDMAARIARQNGARQVQLLLVDGLRWDLGQRVRAVLADRLVDQALCVDESILWSALPTVTPVQVHLLGRGPRGLREELPQSERDNLIHREASVGTLRRIRIGQRDLVKLDVVEARMRDAGPGYDRRLQTVADEVASIVARYIVELPPRTLLYLFGDHGFRLPCDAPDATGPALQGGASPEEVLVPAQSWLVGEVH
jgi:hypothetical protein